MPTKKRPATKTKKTTKARANSKASKSSKSKKISISTKINKFKKPLIFAIVFGFIGAALVLNTFAISGPTFIRKIDVGPQASTYGHTPYGTLKKWTGGSTINEGSAPRDGDGWMRLKGYSFTGPLKIATGNVELSDCEVINNTRGKFDLGTIYSSSSPPSGKLIIDHCHINQGPTGWSNGGITAYLPFEVRYTYISGSGDGIKISRNSLAEHNYIEVNGQGTEASPGHIDGIQGEYFKFDWTARHNTIIGGVGQAPNGGSYRPEHGGNIGIYAPDTPGGSVGYSGAEGVLAEDNYIDGFNTGISLMGTNPNNKSIARNNQFGANFRYYPQLWTRTFAAGRTGDAPGPTNYVIFENNIGDRVLNESTGTTIAYDGKTGVIPDTNSPSEPTPSSPSPTPEPTPTPEPPASLPSTDLPTNYDFSSNNQGWDGQGNTVVSHTGSEGNKASGALMVKVDASGPYPDSSKTARAGTAQYEQGLKASAGQDISATFAVKSSASRNVRCELRFYNGRKILDTVPGLASQSSGNWTARSCSATAPANTTNVALRFFADKAEYGEVYYLDDVTITAGTVAPAPTPTDPTPTPTPAPTPTPPAPEPEPTPTPQPPVDTSDPSAVSDLGKSLSFNYWKKQYSFNLNWKASTDNVAVQDYMVKRNNQVIGNTTDTSFQDYNVNANTYYTYEVTAQDTSGNTSEPTEVTTKAKCFFIWCWAE